jgi:hypothetical protein
MYWCFLPLADEDGDGKNVLGELLGHVKHGGDQLLTELT